MSDGIQERYFERGESGGDFGGPAFYCVEDMHMAMLYVCADAVPAAPTTVVRGAIMAFDIPEDTFTNLERLCVNAPGAGEWEWHPFVSYC
jgi:hypothetical protein